MARHDKLRGGSLETYEKAEQTIGGFVSPVDREKQSRGKAPGPRALGPRGPEPWGETPSFS
jgi:hypothetical protein